MAEPCCDECAEYDQEPVCSRCGCRLSETDIISWWLVHETGRCQVRPARQQIADRIASLTSIHAENVRCAEEAIG